MNTQKVHEWAPLRGPVRFLDEISLERPLIRELQDVYDEEDAIEVMYLQMLHEGRKLDLPQQQELHSSNWMRRRFSESVHGWRTSYGRVLRNAVARSLIVVAGVGSFFNKTAAWVAETTVYAQARKVAIEQIVNLFREYVNLTGTVLFVGHGPPNLETQAAVKRLKSAIVDFDSRFNRKYLSSLEKTHLILTEAIIKLGERDFRGALEDVASIDKHNTNYVSAAFVKFMAYHQLGQAAAALAALDEYDDLGGGDNAMRQRNEVTRIALLVDLGRAEEALRVGEQNLTTLEVELCDVDKMPERRRLTFNVIQTHLNRSSAYRVLENWSNALEEVRAASGRLARIDANLEEYYSAQQLAGRPKEPDASKAWYPMDAFFELRINTMCSESVVLEKLGRMEEAERMLIRATSHSGQAFVAVQDDALMYQYVKTLMQIGALFSRRENASESMRAFALALKYLRMLASKNADNLKMQSVFADCLARVAALTEQSSSLEHAVELYCEAIEAMETAVSMMQAGAENPFQNNQFAVCLERVAYCLATSFYTEVRNGRDALVYAKAACDLMEWNDANAIATLAAAYAEVGHYSLAVELVDHAIQLAGPRNDLLDYRKSYLSEHPWRETRA